jgi:toxin-antitoxin system PIN domain toxin
VWLLDVNVILYAHRAELPAHDFARRWLEWLLASDEVFVVPDGVFASVARIATNRRMVDTPTPIEDVLACCRQIRECAGRVDVQPGPRYWELFEQLCVETNAKGDDIPDAVLVALALEHGLELITFDRGMRRWPGLRWSVPVIPSTD